MYPSRLGGCLLQRSHANVARLLLRAPSSAAAAAAAAPVMALRSAGFAGRPAAALSTSAEAAQAGASAAPEQQQQQPQQQQQQQPAKGRKVGASGAPADSGAKGMIDTNPPRGTRDFLPEDMRLRNWLFGAWADVARAFGFEQFDVPVLESEELFVRKAGEEITDQLYNFEDKGGRRVALRPEITPSLARLVLGRGRSLPLPAKWWTIGQCWRYERTTRGRRREHYQWNMDIVGVAGVEAEAELLAAVTTFFKSVGLGPQDVGIKVSSRKVLAAVLARYGVPDEKFAEVCVVVDKMEKLPRDAVVGQLGALGVPPTAVDGILGALALRSLDDLAALLGEQDGGGGDSGSADNNATNGTADGGASASTSASGSGGGGALSDLRRLWELAAGYGYADWLVFDASVVRGLAYYTGVVFEGFDRAGALRAICGGGRYDKLLGTFGGADAPCAGFGFGDAVIVELLKDRGLLPAPRAAVDDVVLVLDEPLRAAACGVAAKLRAAGRSVDVILEPRKKVKAAIKAAERSGARRLVIVGGDEWARGAVAVRDLERFEQAEVPVDALVAGDAAADNNGSGSKRPRTE